MASIHVPMPDTNIYLYHDRINFSGTENIIKNRILLMLDKSSSANSHITYCTNKSQVIFSTILFLEKAFLEMNVPNNCKSRSRNPMIKQPSSDMITLQFQQFRGHSYRSSDTMPELLCL